MLLLIQFLLAHFVGDFFLQPKRWVESKEKQKLKSPELYYHILVHGILLFILTMEPGLWLPILMLTFSHFVIDAVKISFQNDNSRLQWFFLDQVFHMLAIGVVWYFWTGESIRVIAFNNMNFWLMVLAIVFLTQPTSHIIRNLISRIPLLPENPSITDAGKYIGMIERVFILIFMITNHWQAVGFILAAKSIFRFGDLKGDNRKLTEYVLIGTLLSFGIAIIISLLLFYTLTDDNGALEPILILRYKSD
jgi:hypothetical protein